MPDRSHLEGHPLPAPAPSVPALAESDDFDDLLDDDGNIR
jgi:hypothetical protein